MTLNIITDSKEPGVMMAGVDKEVMGGEDKVEIMDGES